MGIFFWCIACIICPPLCLPVGLAMLWSQASGEADNRTREIVRAVENRQAVVTETKVVPSAERRANRAEFAVHCCRLALSRTLPESDWLGTDEGIQVIRIECQGDVALMQFVCNRLLAEMMAKHKAAKVQEWIDSQVPEIKG